MTYRLFCVITVAFVLAAMVVAQPNTAAAKVPRLADGHPDLSGIWAPSSTDVPPSGIKKAAAGSVSYTKIDLSGRQRVKGAIPGVLPSTPAPSYKPELQAKVKDLFDRESKTDPVFYCGTPGVPRIGAPRRVIQLPNEIVFFYEDIAGDRYRIIPTDGRPHRVNANPSYYGDAVGHWDQDTLVIDIVNFVEDTWLGEGGYFHTDALHVTERLWRDGENLVWQATAEDPNVLTAPWTAPAQVVKPSNVALEESPRCIETAGNLLLNNDHHGQR